MFNLVLTAVLGGEIEMVPLSEPTPIQNSKPLPPSAAPSSLPFTWEAVPSGDRKDPFFHCFYPGPQTKGAVKLCKAGSTCVFEGKVVNGKTNFGGGLCARRVEETTGQYYFEKFVNWVQSLFGDSKTTPGQQQPTAQPGQDSKQLGDCPDCPPVMGVENGPCRNGADGQPACNTGLACHYTKSGKDLVTGQCKKSSNLGGEARKIGSTAIQQRLGAGNCAAPLCNMYGYCVNPGTTTRDRTFGHCPVGHDSVCTPTGNWCCMGMLC